MSGQEITATFVKHDSEKPRTDLLIPSTLIEVAKVLSHGAKKYSPNNWKLCDPSQVTERYVGGAALRHILAYMDGEKIDQDSGLHHLAHAMCSLMFALAFDLDSRTNEK